MENSNSSDFHKNAVFFIETGKIHPNPYQPRREFDQLRLQDLAESIKMYGVLQPLVVTRKEVLKEDGGLTTEYELIAGERRLRASKIAGLREVPALIRAKEDDDKTKLELAIIENLQREDLNPVDRAQAFQQLAEKFGFKHAEIAKKVGKSREYVSNSIRILVLPDEIKAALSSKKLSEGHARPLLMLSDRPEQQEVLFKEILLRRMTVRDAEKISRKIAFDKVRKKERMFDPELVEMEEGASKRLGARVTIEPKDEGGRIRIDYFSKEELQKIMHVINENRAEEDQITEKDLVGSVVNSRGEIGGEYEREEKQESEQNVINDENQNFSQNEDVDVESKIDDNPEIWQEQNPDENQNLESEKTPEEDIQTPDYSDDEDDDSDDDSYSVKNFNI
ncbi:ParB/RepB/Spo0J family partition protein [Candidatus Parcubacteria bacterium]|nr:ParB/RepB/Spo0J family partition protein [Candidatus Parcubacteria bacterium]